MSLNQIITLIQKGDLKSSENIAMEMHMQDPVNYEVIKTIGLINLLRKDYIKSIEYYEKAFEKKHDDYEVILNLANAYSESFDVEKSNHLLQIAMTKNESDARIYFNFAENYIKRRDFDNAFEYITKCIDLNGGLIACAADPSLTDTINKYLDICLSLNKKELLYESYTKIMDYAFHAEVFSHWCNHDSSSIPKKYIEKAKEKLDENFPNDMIRSKNLNGIYFSLAQVEKNNKKLSEEYYILGNKCVKEILRYNPIVEQKRIKKLIKIFSNKDISKFINEDRSRGEGIIFVLGLPRSGTTLTESILSTADNIISAGETTILGGLTKKFQNADYDENIIYKEDINLIANNYERMIKALSSGNYKFIIDKMPGNYFNIGFILLCLPAAKIINLNRDPWDNATSLFQQHYITNIPYSSSFFNIGIHIANYEEIMKFWKSCILFNKQNFLEISYKALVTNTHEKAKEIFDFCQLDGTYQEENRKGFFARTASKNQVTQGVYKSSLNKEIFADFKSEFLESLASQREYWSS